MCEKDIMRKQIEYVRKIINDEVWLEGQRRRCAVDPSDRQVKLRVCDIVQETGAGMRERAIRELRDEMFGEGGAAA